MTGFMDDSFDITTLLILVVAVVVFLRLRSVLGRRTGNEKPRYDPVSTNGNGAPPPDTVIAMPMAARPVSDAETQRSAEERLESSRQGECARQRTARRRRADQNFDPQVPGRRQVAYETIVTAFAKGNRKLLKPLLGREVYEGFDGAITRRETNGETVEFSFIGISKADIASAELVRPHGSGDGAIRQRADHRHPRQER
jgi:predicted lipid-binding transport protein (Tim44 family)